MTISLFLRGFKISRFDRAQFYIISVCEGFLLQFFVALMTSTLSINMDEKEGGVDKMKVGVQGAAADNNVNNDSEISPVSTGEISSQMDDEKISELKNNDESLNNGTTDIQKTHGTLPDSKDSKLCGWLHITSNRGPLKTNRLRWFVYSDTTSRLYYYRNPHDFLPLGEIDISHATFYFDPSKTDKLGGFEIRLVMYDEK